MCKSPEIRQAIMHDARETGSSRLGRRRGEIGDKLRHLQPCTDRSNVRAFTKVKREELHRDRQYITHVPHRKWEKGSKK